MPFKIFSHVENELLSNRLWQPNTGGKSVGGHAVLLTGLFETGGVRSIVVSDPNYRTARIWPLSNLDRWSKANMWAWTIWGKAVAPKK